jgi:hypothetical protein
MSIPHHFSISIIPDDNEKLLRNFKHNMLLMKPAVYFHEP